MKYIESSSHDVYFNLALEEYAFQNLKDEEYFMLWENDNSIVLGKHQNVFEEINIKEAEKTGMKVARRNSGGGTVFHDKKNINYSFIKNINKNTFIDYDSFLTPVIEALNSLGIKAEKRRTCDIAIDGRKISGSAQSSKSGRVLHHGTLLFNSDLSLLEKMLKPSDGKIESKSTKSFRSIVTNIKEHLNEDVTLESFKESLLKALFPEGIEKLVLSNEQLQEISNLAKEKYNDWNWNFGSSPNFSFEKESVILNDKIKVVLFVKKGIVNEIKITGDAVPCSLIESAIKGSRYSYFEIVNKLKDITLNINNIEELADCFF